MTGIDTALLLGALVVSALTIRSNPRGVVWVGAAALDFIVSTAYWRSGFGYPEAVAGVCDVAVCLAVYSIGRQQWEMWVWRLFQTSLAINVLYLAGNLGIFRSIPHDAYASMLEAINWLLLLLIGGMSALQRIGAYDYAGAHRPWDRLRWAMRTLREKRHAPAFFTVP